MDTTVVDDPHTTQATDGRERSRPLHVARGEQWPCCECDPEGALAATPDRIEASLSRFESIHNRGPR